MVGSHQAGAETFKPLVDEAVSCLLAPPQPTARRPAGQRHASRSPPGTMRICFVGVENKSAEEIGDFKDQIYQVIDSRILESHVFQPISQRFVEAGLMETRLRPDQFMIPENRRVFARVMEQQGQTVRLPALRHAHLRHHPREQGLSARLPADHGNGQPPHRRLRQAVGDADQGLPPFSRQPLVSAAKSYGPGTQAALRGAADSRHDESAAGDRDGISAGPMLDVRLSRARSACVAARRACSAGRRLHDL